MTKIPSDDVLESLYKLRIRESEQIKTVLELYDMEILQKISIPNCLELKTMVKRSTDQKLRLRNFDARHRKIGTGAVVKSRKGIKWHRERKRNLLSVENKKVSVREETTAVSDTRVMIVKTDTKSRSTL